MRAGAFIGLGAAMLCGCANFRELPPEDRVSIADVLNQVECEIHGSVGHYIRAAQHGHANFRKEFNRWSAIVSLTLETTDEASIAAGMAFGNPLTSGVMQLAFNSKANEKIHRLADVTVSFTLISLMEQGCDTPPPADGRRGVYFSNDTGVKEWFRRAIDATDAANNFPPTDLSHSLEFTLTLSGDGKGGWKFVHSGPSTAGTLSISDNYKLKVAFKRDADAAKQKRSIGKLGKPGLAPASPKAQEQLRQLLLQLELKSLQLR